MKLVAFGILIMSVHADRSMCGRPANTDLCSTLLTEEIIAQEQEKDCPCYNFCGGIYVAPYIGGFCSATFKGLGPSTSQPNRPICGQGYPGLVVSGCVLEDYAPDRGEATGGDDVGPDEVTNPPGGDPQSPSTTLTVTSVQVNPPPPQEEEEETPNGTQRPGTGGANQGGSTWTVTVNGGPPETVRRSGGTPYNVAPNRGGATGTLQARSESRSGSRSGGMGMASSLRSYEAAPHLRPTTVLQAVDVCQKVWAGGATSLAAALWPYYEKKRKIDRIVLVTDEEENTQTHGLFFCPLLKRYKAEVYDGVELIVICVDSGDRRFRKSLLDCGIDCKRMEIDGRRPDLTKFDALLGQIAMSSSPASEHEDNLQQEQASAGENEFVLV